MLVIDEYLAAAVTSNRLAIGTSDLCGFVMDSALASRQ